MRWRHKVIHPQKNRIPGDITRVANMLGMSQPPSLNCRPALLLCHASSIYHVLNFVKGWLMLEFIMSWPVFLCFTYMEVTLSWPGSPSHWHPKLSHWQSTYQMFENSGTRNRRWIGNTMSVTLRPDSWGSSKESFHSDIWKMSMLRSWNWSWNTSAVRGGSLVYMPITWGCSCTLQRCRWWTSHFSFVGT